MKEFEKEIIKTQDQITLSDMDRSSRYAKDLVQGLAKIREFPQGVTIFGSARFAEDEKYYKDAVELGEKLAKNNISVITGGGPGVMEAANKGALKANGRSIGFNIHIATEQDLNPYTNIGMEFQYFFSRKLMMTLASRVYVFFPGGFGTMDEFAEILELKHTGKTINTPIFLYGSEFWSGLDEWFGGKMSEWNLIETGKKGEFDEIIEFDDDNHPMSEFSGNFAKKGRKLAADEKLGHKTLARDLYVITDDIDEIVAAAVEANSQEDPKKLEEKIRKDIEKFAKKNESEK